MESIPRGLIEDCLYNWLGYGNPNGKFWFVGFEESLNLARCTNVHSREEYFQLRSEFDVTEDLEEVYHKKLGRHLSTFDRDTAWHKIARFLIAWEGREPDLNMIQDYVVGFDAKIGRGDSNNLTVETFPLIKARNSDIGMYGSIWESNQQYHDEVLPRRIDLMVETLEANSGVDWIYIYGLSNPVPDRLLQRFPRDEIGTWPSGMRTSDPQVYQLHLNEARTVNLIHGPFFKRGMTNDAIENLAIELRSEFE